MQINLKKFQKNLHEIVEILYQIGIIVMYLRNVQVRKGVRFLDSDKLKGRLKENRLTYEDCASALGISVTTFSSKINGRSQFKLVEANKLAKLLKLTGKEKTEIFLK